MSRSELSRGLYERALKVSPGGVNLPVRAFATVDGEPFFVGGAQERSLAKATEQG